MIAARMLCTRKTQLVCMVQDTIAQLGEGAILQKCKSLYEPGRSPWLFKFKVLLQFHTILLCFFFPPFFFLFPSFPSPCAKIYLVILSQASRGDQEALVVRVTEDHLELQMHVTSISFSSPLSFNLEHKITY